MFIVGRAIAGLGAAGILQGALSIIGYAVELKDRPLYMGIVISVFVVSTCLGPVLGGAFTDRTTWRWCFWMYVYLPIVGS
jgi:MFS family permease